MKRRTVRPSRSQSCTGKNKYSRDVAEDMARYVMGQDGSLMDTYRCSHGCRLPDGSAAWHIGHRIRTKRA